MKVTDKWFHETEAKIKDLAAEVEATKRNMKRIRNESREWCKKWEKATAEVEGLKKRLEPPEFFETEVLSLEQIMPLDCRAEANAVIDAAIAEVWAKEAQIKTLKEALEKKDNAIALLNSMVEGGESHSEISRSIAQQASEMEVK